jgi:RNA polymerase sigma factor (TIGR02999 family)
MRRVLVDFARSRKRKKRGEGQFHLPLDAAPEVAARIGPDLLAVDEAMNNLGVIDARKVKVVELRFFGGLTEEETAAALNISVETVGREWRFAKVWLRKEIARGNKSGS